MRSPNRIARSVLALDQKQACFQHRQVREHGLGRLR